MSGNPTIRQIDSHLNLVAVNQQIKDVVSDVAIQNTTLYLQAWKSRSQIYAMVERIPEIWRRSITTMVSCVYLDEKLRALLPGTRDFRFILCTTSLSVLFDKEDEAIDKTEDHYLGIRT